jgi:hypothetical protein
MNARRVWQFFAALIVVPLVCIGFVLVTPPIAHAGPELVLNGSVETVGATASVPLGWNTGGWGTNTRTFSYPSTGGHTGSRGLTTRK